MNAIIKIGDAMSDKRELALKLWKDIYGNSMWAQDCFGTWMYRDDYGVYDKKRNNRPGGTGNYYVYGWDIDHIMPINSFENESKATFLNNLEPLQHSNNLAKSDQTSFEIGDEDYQVVICEICKRHNRKGYGIKNVKTGRRVDWKYTKNLFYDTDD